jgi:hypothetical protein
MHDRMLPVVVFTALFALFGCGGGQEYKEAVDINTQFVDAMESYIGDIDQAGDAAAVADAIESYAQKMEELAPQLKAIAAKHPEWKEMKTMPDELKPIQERAKQLASRIPDTFMKTMKYMTDAQVQDAHKRLQESMAKMQ